MKNVYARGNRSDRLLPFSTWENRAKIIARILHDGRQTAADCGIRWHLAASPKKKTYGYIRRWRWDFADRMSGPGRIRTCDARFRKPTLYPLSYEANR